MSNALQAPDADVMRHIQRLLAPIESEVEEAGDGDAFFPGKFSEIEPQSRNAQSFYNTAGSIVDIDASAGARRPLTTMMPLTDTLKF